MEVLRLEVTICDLKRNIIDSICVTEVVMCSASPFANSRDAGNAPVVAGLFCASLVSGGLCCEPRAVRAVRCASSRSAGGRTLGEAGGWCQCN